MTDVKPQSKDSGDRKLPEDRKVAVLTVLDVLKTKRHFFYLTVSLTLIGTCLGHFFTVSSYETASVLFVQDTNLPSAAEYLLNQPSYRGSGTERTESYVNHLNSDSFLLRVAEKIKFNKEFNSLNMEIPDHKSLLSLRYWRSHLLGDGNNFKPNERELKLLMPVEKIASFIRKTVTYSYDYNSQFIRIKARTLDAQTSQLIANLIAEEFVNMTNRHNLNEVREIEEFIVEKKKQSEKRVQEIDKKLVRFKQKNRIISADESVRSLASRISKLDIQIQDADVKQKENQKILDQLNKARNSSYKKIFRDGASTQGFASEETTVILESRVEQLKNEKSAYLAQGLTEANWRVQKLNQEINKNLARLKTVMQSPNRYYSHLKPEELRNKMDNLKTEQKTILARISTLRAARVKLQTQVDALPSIEQDFIQLDNQFKTEIANLASLERKEKELEIQRISHKKEVRIDQMAEIPAATPRGSLVKKLLFSSLAAMFLGLLIVLGLESLDPSVKSRQDMFDCGLEFFGEIPFVTSDKPRKRSGRFQFGTPEDLVCKNNPESVESMSFKYMRARIESMRYKENKDCQLIAISSALHNEGKSFVAANLAISLAQLNRKVLLIDADLRRPSQSAYFNLSSQDGLVDLLGMKKDLEEVVVEGLYNNLHILPAGFNGNDSTELISSHKFRLLIDHLRNEYDYLVIDTPPTFAVVDAAIISSFADIPILVSSFRDTRKADLYEAYNDLLQVSYKTVYGVINKAIVSNSRIHYYGYPIYGKSVNDTSAFVNKEEDADEFLKKLRRKSG